MEKLVDKNDNPIKKLDITDYFPGYFPWIKNQTNRTSYQEAVYQKLLFEQATEQFPETLKNLEDGRTE